MGPPRCGADLALEMESAFNCGGSIDVRLQARGAKRTHGGRALKAKRLEKEIADPPSRFAQALHTGDDPPRGDIPPHLVIDHALKRVAL